MPLTKPGWKDFPTNSSETSHTLSSHDEERTSGSALLSSSPVPERAPQVEVHSEHGHGKLVRVHERVRVIVVLVQHLLLPARRACGSPRPPCLRLSCTPPPETYSISHHKTHLATSHFLTRAPNHARVGCGTAHPSEDFEEQSSEENTQHQHVLELEGEGREEEEGGVEWQARGRWRHGSGNVWGSRAIECI
jgi:hypothetical protein